MFFQSQSRAKSSGQGGGWKFDCRCACAVFRYIEMCIGRARKHQTAHICTYVLECIDVKYV